MINIQIIKYLKTAVIIFRVSEQTYLTMARKKGQLFIIVPIIIKIMKY